MTESPVEGNWNGEADAIQVCPYLKLKHDPETAATYARRDHACAMQNNRLVSVGWQQEFCLTQEHTRCPFYADRAPPNVGNGFAQRVSANRREFLILVIALLLLVAAAAVIAAGGVFPSDEAPSGSNQGDSAEIISDTPTPTATTPPTSTPAATATPTSDDGEEEEQSDTAEPTEVAGLEIADGALEAVWNTLDLPVRNDEAERGWLWGPEPITDAMEEPYADAPGGVRTVQYFEKSRMEINDPTADPDADWYVTTGLLVVEMVYGHIQIGDDEVNDSPSPANVPIQDNLAGDFLLTYADIQDLGLDEAGPIPEGDTIAETIVDGDIVTEEEYEEYAVTSAVVVEAGSVEHGVASVFWDFMTSQGTIWLDGDFVTDNLFFEPFFATGYPLTEPYWVTVELDGEDTDLLWQCFERRCLTYTPGNEPGWEVEASNVGLHYYEWRYGSEP